MFGNGADIFWHCKDTIFPVTNEKYRKLFPVCKCQKWHNETTVQKMAQWSRNHRFLADSFALSYQYYQHHGHVSACIKFNICCVRTEKWVSVCWTWCSRIYARCALKISAQSRCCAGHIQHSMYFFSWVYRDMIISGPTNFELILIWI